MYYYLLALIIFLIDQATKWLVVQYMNLDESISIIGDFFTLYSHRNRGAAFGILQDQLWFFIVVTIIVLGGIIWFMQRAMRKSKGHRMMLISLAIVLGGAIGNFVDRLASGEVVDFLKFEFKFGSDFEYTYPIFNVADSAIVVGAILLIIDSLISIRREKREGKA